MQCQTVYSRKRVEKTLVCQLQKIKPQLIVEYLVFSVVCYN